MTPNLCILFSIYIIGFILYKLFMKEESDIETSKYRGFKIQHNKKTGFTKVLNKKNKIVRTHYRGKDNTIKLSHHAIDVMLKNCK